MLDRPIVHMSSAYQPSPTFTLAWLAYHTDKAKLLRKSIRRHGSKVRDFLLAFPLQAYASTLDYSKSCDSHEMGYVSP